MFKKNVAEKITKSSFVLISSAFISSCASVSVDDYPNITINDDNKIETVRFTHPQSPPMDTVRLCVLDNVDNGDIPIEHSVGSWAALTIFVLVPDEKDSIKGGDVILSEENGVIRAAGNVELESTVNGRNFLLFLLNVDSGAEEGTELLFRNPSFVVEDTGFGQHKGAIPLGAHALSIFEKHYEALEGISNRFGSCLQRT